MADQCSQNFNLFNANVMVFPGWAHYIRFVRYKVEYLVLNVSHRFHRTSALCAPFAIQTVWYTRVRFACIVLSISIHKCPLSACMHMMLMLFCLVHISLSATHQILINRGVIYIVRERRSDPFFCSIYSVLQ